MNIEIKYKDSVVRIEIGYKYMNHIDVKNGAIEIIKSVINQLKEKHG